MLHTSRDDLCKQFGSRWDAAERGISSGSKLFAIETILQKEKSKYLNLENFEQTTILADEKFSKQANKFVCRSSCMCACARVFVWVCIIDDFNPSMVYSFLKYWLYPGKIKFLYLQFSLHVQYLFMTLNDYNNANTMKLCILIQLHKHHLENA